MRLVKWCFGIIILVGVFVGVTPLAARLMAVNWLEKQGYDAQIRSLSIDLLFGEFEVAGVDIKAQDGRRIEIGKMEGELNIPGLFRNELIIKKLSSLGLKINRGTTDASFAQELDRFFDGPGAKWQLNLEQYLAQHTEACHQLPGDSELASERCLSIDQLMLIRVTAGQSAAGWSIQAREPVQISKAYFKDQSNNLTIVYLGEAEISNLLLSKTISRASNIDLSNFHLIESEHTTTATVSTPYQTQFSRLLLNRVEVVSAEKGDAINIHFIEATSWRQALHKNENAVLIAVDQMEKYFPNFTQALTNQLPKEERGKVQVKVNKTVVKEGVIAWLDDSVQPSANEVIRNLRIDLGTMATNRQEDPVTLSMQAVLGDKGTVNLRGLIYPFLDDHKFGLQGSIVGVDLSHISGYTQSVLGERVDSGRFDAKFELNSDKGQVRLSSKVRLGNWLMDPAGTVNGRGMRVSKSFNMLKNASGVVELDLPLTHRLAPDSETFGSAFGKQLRMTLSQKARRQFGSVGAVTARNDGPSSVSMEFEPLYYVTNARNLQGEQLDRFDEILRLMQQKPHLVLRLCANSTGGEWASLYNNDVALTAAASVTKFQKRSLKELSESRRRTLETKLKSNGFNLARVEFCEPAVRLDKDGPAYLSVAY